MILWYMIGAFFIGVMVRWDRQLRRTRRTLLDILRTRGRCTEEDLWECGGDEIHPPSFRLAVRWITESRKEAVCVQDPASSAWMYELTPFGRRVAEALHQAQERKQKKDAARPSA